MTVNAIEKALWQACANPKEGKRFREDAQSYLKDFRIDEQERSLITSWDVSGIAARGVNPMVLMMAFVAVNGVAKAGEYVGKINSPGQAAPSR